MSASSGSERMPQRQLGELMTELGLISGEQLATVLEVQQKSKRPLGQIIVELGFASGAAVAHALAMQSGGALRTEYGFALGVSPEHADSDADGSRTGLPKLRLAPTAVVPPVRANLDPVEEPQIEQVDEIEEVAEVTDAEPDEIVPEDEEIADVEPEQALAETDAIPNVEPEEVLVETEAIPSVEPEELLVETEASLDAPPTVETDTVETDTIEAGTVELEQLRAKIERLEAALAGATEREQELNRLREAHEHATNEIERLQSTLSEAETDRELELTRLRDEHERATSELEHLRTTLAEAQDEREHELTRLRQEHERAVNELEPLRTALAEAQAAASEQERRLAEEQERHAGERSELTTQRDRLQEELGDVLDRLAAAGTAAEERDQLRVEIERLEATFAETQAAAAAERERLLADIDTLENTLAATQTAHEQELGRLREEHEHTRAELERLQAALDEAQTAAAEQERHLAEEQERHAGERSELAIQRDRLQEELGGVLERLAVVGPAAEERDELRTEVEQLRAANAETQEAWAADLRRMAEERDNVMAELAEARELLLQAERVRESQIALAAERDRAVAELEQLRTIAADAQAAAEEQTHLLAEEQDRRHEERESLVAQRTLLEEELGAAIEQLAAAGAAADEREAQLQLRSQRLLEALDAVRRLAAELEPETAGTAKDQPEAETEIAEPESEGEPIHAESGPVEYSLFVPSPDGYELVPQTGVPPHAGETVEIVLPDRSEPTVFEVVRSGRTLPGGDVCVYLAQV